MLVPVFKKYLSLAFTRFNFIILLVLFWLLSNKSANLLLTLASITGVVPLTNNGPASSRGDDQLPPSLKESTIHMTENLKELCKLDIIEMYLT